MARWMVRIDLGRGPDGRRQRKYTYAATQAAAVDQLRKLGGRAADGELLTTSTPTVKTFLDDWFSTNGGAVFTHHLPLSFCSPTTPAAFRRGTEARSQSRGAQVDI